MSLVRPSENQFNKCLHIARYNHRKRGRVNESKAKTKCALFVLCRTWLIHRVTFVTLASIHFLVVSFFILFYFISLNNFAASRHFNSSSSCHTLIKLIRCFLSLMPSFIFIVHFISSLTPCQLTSLQWCRLHGCNERENSWLVNCNYLNIHSLWLKNILTFSHKCHPRVLSTRTFLSIVRLFIFLGIFFFLSFFLSLSTVAFVTTAFSFHFLFLRPSYNKSPGTKEQFACTHTNARAAREREHFSLASQRLAVFCALLFTWLALILYSPLFLSLDLFSLYIHLVHASWPCMCLVRGANITVFKWMRGSKSPSYTHTDSRTK